MDLPILPKTLSQEWFSIQEQLLRRIVNRFRGGLVFKAHRLLYHSSLGSSVTKKRQKAARANSTSDPASTIQAILYEKGIKMKLSGKEVYYKA
jgi:hypothetical protein